MKKVLIFGSIGVLLYLLLRPSFEPTMLEIAQRYEERWGIELPEPQRFEQVWATKYAAHGDGEWYSVLHFEQELPTPRDADLIKITEKNDAIISGKVSRFIINTIDTHLGDTETHTAIREAFDNNPIEFSFGDYYFHKAENGGNDYIIGVYSKSQKKIYLLEWHQ
ncbi:hypothetical protein LZ480_15680 [Solibacillus sp. MA9]|uniref:Uncharacterized protein n=1 Tax=Solibacillus palustris TaxID=2908203 RepID=A0ABS9UG59_9BACL|nr:hypothetical protein [Solibacillus sp. MA9]MCH7323316.1 hypothetical protein [Solibacillus sp. MA9]